MKNLIAVFALALSLIGCASVNMGDAKQDEALKTFTIEKDKAGVYIYRNESMGAAIKMNVELDGQAIGQTAANWPDGSQYVSIQGSHPGKAHIYIQD
jgi:hypothetical protein